MSILDRFRLWQVMRLIKQGKVRQITFTKEVQPFITSALGTLRGRKCVFCGTRLNQQNFAGASKKIGFFCSNFLCLIQLSKEKEIKNNLEPSNKEVNKRTKS